MGHDPGVDKIRLRHTRVCYPWQFSAYRKCTAVKFKIGACLYACILINIKLIIVYFFRYIIILHS